MSPVYSCRATTSQINSGWVPVHKNWEEITYRLGMEWKNSCYVDWDKTQNKSSANKQDAEDSRTVIVPWIKRLSRLINVRSTLHLEVWYFNLPCRTDVLDFESCVTKFTIFAWPLFFKKEDDLVECHLCCPCVCVAIVLTGVV